MNGLMDGWMDEGMGGWMDGGRDGYIEPLGQVNLTCPDN